MSLLKAFKVTAFDDRDVDSAGDNVPVLRGTVYGMDKVPRCCLLTPFHEGTHNKLFDQERI